jgi:hypothetical protein
VKRAILVLFLALTMNAATAAPLAAQDEEYTIPQGAVTWVVDQDAQTITVTVKLEVFAACESCPWAGTSGGRVLENQFLIDKVRSQIDRIWNKPYHYRCYKPIFVVDITLGGDRDNIDSDRIGVAIDYSAVAIRSSTTVLGNGQSNETRWSRNDPAARIKPINSADGSIWRSDGSKTTYAHEFGHILGLDDAYDHQTLERFADAPDDLMSSYENENIDQTTIDRLVERNRDQLVDAKDPTKKLNLSDLKCDLEIDAKTVQQFVQTGNHVPKETAEFDVIVKRTGPDSYEGTGTMESDMVGGEAATGLCATLAHYTTAIMVDAKVSGNELVITWKGPPIKLPVTCDEVVYYHFLAPGGFDTGAVSALFVPAVSGNPTDGYNFEGAHLDYDCRNNVNPDTPEYGPIVTCTWTVDIKAAPPGS